MKHGHQHAGSFLAAVAAMVISAVGVTAEAQVLAQDLLSVRASGKVAAATWTRRQDSYTLQIAFPFSCARPRAPAVALQEAPQGTAPEAGQLERSTFFIGNTIANLRGLDPANGGCTLTLIDGRRSAAGASPPAPARPAEPAAPQKVVAATPRDPQTIQVWLLRADGTQIPPIAVATETSNAYGCRTNCPTSGKLYRFALGDSAQAVAAAIQIDDAYYIEKLRSLEPSPGAQ